MTKNGYQVLARKYRPQKFADVVAQDPIVTTLKNAIQMKRTAHAYLFCGGRGCGKTTVARLFAKALNCTAPSDDHEPCNHCSSCCEIAAGHAIDVLEIDGASHRGIEDIRHINETIGFTPVGGRYKIYLIDEVHMLTKEAFNALLKTLEEPPSHVKFFFCTTESHRIPATIVSRCQRFNLRRIPVEKIQQQLSYICQENGITAEPQALTLIAEKAEGSLRDALSIFDQIIAFEKGAISAQTVTEMFGLPPQDICFALDEAIFRQDIAALFKIAAEVFSSGCHLAYFTEELIAHFRLLLLVKCGQKADKKIEETAKGYRKEQLIQILEMVIEGQQALKVASSEKTAFEMLLLRMARTQQQLPLETLVQRLLTMEKKFSTNQSFEVPSPNSEKLAPQISEDPLPLPSDLPLKPAKVELKKESLPPSIQEQSRFDTVMRFAAKELNGSIKKI